MRLRSVGGSVQSGIWATATGPRGVSVCANRRMICGSTRVGSGQSASRSSVGRAKRSTNETPARIASLTTLGPSSRVKPRRRRSRTRWSRTASTIRRLCRERIGSGRDGSAVGGVGGLDQRRERRRIVHGQVGEHLAVHFDAGGLHAGDQLGVGGAVLAGGGVDAGDPQLPELAFAGTAVPVGVLAGVHHLLVGGAEPAAAGSLVALCLVEDLLVGLAGRDWVSGSCHVLPPVHLLRRRFAMRLSPGARSDSPLRRRKTSFPLASFKCPRPACRRRYLPEPVTLMRFLAPLWVFIFGMVVSFLFTRGRCFLLLLLGRRPPGRSQHHRHVATLHGRGLLDHGLIAQFVDQSLEQLPPELGTLLFTTTEADRHLDLVTFGEELLGLAAVDVEVMVSDPYLHPKLFDRGARLLLARFTIPDGLFVFVLAVVHQAADRWIGVRRHLHQVEIQLFGQPECLSELLDPDLFSVGGDHPHLGGADVSVHTQLSDVSTSWSIG